MTDAAAANPHDPRRPSIGVEEEFLLVDPATGQPLLCNERVAAAARAEGVALQLELSQCQVETNTPVCWTSRVLREQLLALRSQVAAVALREGCRLIATGAPILGPWRLPISSSERYRNMQDRFGILAVEQGVCGCHVHVDVPDRETAVQVCNHVRPWLPTVLALAANSSVHRGLDSGYASWRSILWSRWPASGPPPLFRSVEHYNALVDTMVDSGLLMDERMVYWDIRPSCHLPTVEIRVADVQGTVDETVLLATMIRALVMAASRAVGAGVPAPAVPLETLRAATWIAARDGLAGRAIDPGVGNPTSARAMLTRLVGMVRDELEELGEYDRVRDQLHRQLDAGNGADWQRRALREHRDPARVVGLAATRTLQDALSPGGRRASGIPPSAAPREMC
ncbi:carboxylate-amine ligase [Rhodococcus sp. NPDC054953]